MNFTSCAELECTVFERTVNAAVFAMLLIKFFFKRSSDVICSALAWTWHREELRPQFALLRAFSAPFRCCSRISGSTRCQCVTLPPPPLRSHGPHNLVAVLQTVREETDEDPDG